LECPRIMSTDVDGLPCHIGVPSPGPWRVECPHPSVPAGGSHDALSSRTPHHPQARPPRGATRRRRAAAKERPPHRIGDGGGDLARWPLELDAMPVGFPKAFRQGLRALGYVEGHTILVE
jgi:hypothetical protein